MKKLAKKEIENKKSNTSRKKQLKKNKKNNL